MHHSRIAPALLGLALVLTACGGGGGAKAASSASPSSSSSSSSSSSQSAQAKKAAAAFQAAKKAADSPSNAVFEQQQKDYVAQDLAALKADERKYRDIDFEFDKAIRAIDFPSDVTPDVNAYLQANGDVIGAEDKVQNAADIAEYHRLDRKATRIAVTRVEAGRALLRALGSPDPSDLGDPQGAPSATGKVVFKDDFSDPASGWSTGSNNNGTFGYQGSAYQIALTATQGAVVSDTVLEGAKKDPKLESLDNVSASVTVAKQQDAGGNAGLVCHEDALASTGYAAAIDTTGDWVITRLNGRSSTELKDSNGNASRGVSSVIKETGANDVRIDCVTKGKTVTVTLFVNGKQLGQGSDSNALPPGAVAMFADSTVAVCCNAAVFDDIEIRDLS